MKKTALMILSLGLLLAACQPAPRENRPPLPTSQAMAPFQLDVARVEVVNDYVVSQDPAFVDVYFSPTPTTAVRNWAHDRFQSAGNSGRLEVNIKDASVRETRLPITQGFKGVFTDDQAERYDAKLEVALKIYDERSNLPAAQIDLSVARSQTLHEKATVEERDQLFSQLERETMDELNAQAEKQIPNYFARFLRQ